MKYPAIVASALLLAAIGFTGNAFAHGDAYKGVSFAAPQDGATVSGEFKVEMKVDGMAVQPAGEAVEGSGHHHLIVDGQCIRKGEAVPKDATHMHFGKGQMETTLNLAPGKHTLTLQFANGMHQSYGKHWCKSIHVSVE